MGATYNSLERQQLDAPRCHPNTRVAVIKRLLSWIKGEIDFDALMLWLYGAAGAGKSAIAHMYPCRDLRNGWTPPGHFLFLEDSSRAQQYRSIYRDYYLSNCSCDSSLAPAY